MRECRCAKLAHIGEGKTYGDMVLTLCLSFLRICRLQGGQWGKEKDRIEITEKGKVLGRRLHLMEGGPAGMGELF